MILNIIKIMNYSYTQVFWCHSHEDGTPVSMLSIKKLAAKTQRHKVKTKEYLFSF